MFLSSTLMDNFKFAGLDWPQTRPDATSDVRDVPPLFQLARDSEGPCCLPVRTQIGEPHRAVCPQAAK